MCAGALDAKFGHVEWQFAEHTGPVNEPVARFPRTAPHELAHAVRHWVRHKQWQARYTPVCDRIVQAQILSRTKFSAHDFASP